ncbi:MAG: YlmC/YmxH family sporulation protein [Clostridia bacterium]|nr:YlmC/YmxH family sporulation protein [Clostridia bacterium]
MVTTSDLRMKEVINILNGSRIGFVYDFEINLDKNRIEALIVPKEGKFLKIFSKESDYIISWKRIVKIGQDVILVELKEPVYFEEDKVESKDIDNVFLDVIESEEEA